MKNNKANYRFPLWLTVIFFGLICIPLLIYIGNELFAKIFGVFILVTTSIALRFWLVTAKSSATKYSTVKLNKNDTFELERLYPFYKKLNNQDKSVLFNRMGLFLANTPIVDEIGNLLSKEQSIEIALVLALVFYDSPQMEYDFNVENCSKHDFLIEMRGENKYYVGDFRAVLGELRTKTLDLGIESLVNTLEIKKIKNIFY